MKHRWLYAFTALLIGTHGSASAQVWPAKPIRVIVPVSAGSTTDIVARLVLDQLSSRLGQPIMVENRPGAGGTTGTAFNTGDA